MEKKAVSAGGVVVNGGRICLVLQKVNNKWSFPKGHANAGEGVEDAARREIFEETGLRLEEPLKKLGFIERLGRIDEGDEWKQIHLFLFRTSEEKLAPNDSRIARAEWFQFDDAVAHLGWDVEKEFLLKHVGEIFR